jgi:hypothetical protein
MVWASVAVALAQSRLKPEPELGSNTSQAKPSHTFSRLSLSQFELAYVLAYLTEP